MSCLAWSPWKRVRGGDEGDNNKSKAFLAYGFRGKVYICPITVSLESGDYSRPPGDHDPSRLSAVAGNRLVVGNSISDVHLVSAITWAEEVRFFALHTHHTMTPTTHSCTCTQPRVYSLTRNDDVGDQWVPYSGLCYSAQRKDCRYQQRWGGHVHQGVCEWLCGSCCRYVISSIMTMCKDILTLRGC